MKAVAYNLIIAAAALNVAISSAQAPSLGEWFTRASLPTPRQEVPHAVLNGKIYVPGGFLIGGAATSIVEVFAPATNTWSALPSLPITMHHLAFVAANGKLYVLGGYTGNSFSPTARVFEFDFTSFAWNEKASMPFARGAAVAVEHNGKIFVIGGVNSANRVLSVNQMYDPIANTWTTLSSMPTPREHLAGAAMDSLIYVVGGRDFSRGGNTNKLEAYSSATDKWYTLSNMPTARGGLAAAALNGKLYVFGGEFPGVFSEAEEYDPATNTWRQLAPMPSPRHGMGAAAVADTIFIIGGAPVAGFGVTDVNAGFTLASLSTSVHQESSLPRHPALFQNYPNPFNAGTSIRFSTSTRSRVTLKIFDRLGREMATLVDGIAAPGIHTVSWQSEDTPSGLYFYQLRTECCTLTRKLTMLK